MRPRSVLDIGAGQSTLLWAILRKHGLVGDVLTLESDSDWGARIAAQVPHEVVVAPLADRTIAGRSVRTYDWDRVRRARRYDVMICDGPNGVLRHSRRGILSLLDETLADDFLLILDDAERIGEQDTVSAIHARLQSLKIAYDVGVVRAAKTQVIFAAGRYIPATFL